MLRKIVMAFSYLMVSVFLGLGIFILVTGRPQEFSSVNRNGLAIILIIYGLLRAFRVYQKYQ
ncbi:MAG: hypothetical protein V4616_13115 [Bacteroidota bacterium]